MEKKYNKRRVHMLRLVLIVIGLVLFTGLIAEVVDIVCATKERNDETI